MLHIIKGKHIFCCLEMPVFQAFLAYGDEFALVGSCSAAFGKPIDGGIPEQVLFACHDPFHIGFDVLVFVYGNSLFEGFCGEQFREFILPANFSELCCSDKVLQYLSLCRDGMLYPGFNAPGAQSGQR